MKFFPIFLIFFFQFLNSGKAEIPPIARKIPNPMVPPLQLGPSCHVVSCYRNIFNKSDSCAKSEYLHSFKKCDKKFYREDICCKK